MKRQREQTSEPDHGRHVEMIRLECKTTMINMLRTLMDKVDGIQEEMDKEDSKASILKEPKRYTKDQNT